MLQSLYRQAISSSTSLSLDTCCALTEASAALGRLDQVSAASPLITAIMYRTRLDAVRSMAAAEGKLIDQWHLAAILEGLRLRMDDHLRIVDRGMLFDAARGALEFHQWLATPNEDQVNDTDRAAAFLDGFDDRGGPLLAAAFAMHSWIEEGGKRAPMWAALPSYWVRAGILSRPLPITGAPAMSPDNDWDMDAWLPVFLRSLASEANTQARLSRDLDRAWKIARQAVAGKRKNSQAPAAVDLLAASPALSATTLAARLGIAVKNAARILDDLLRDGVVIEVSRRSKRRLFSLPSMAPVREATAGPKRPEPFRGRGRPRREAECDIEDERPNAQAEVDSPPLPHVVFDYSELDAAISSMEDAIRRTKTFLDHAVNTNPATEALRLGITTEYEDD